MSRAGSPSYWAPRLALHPTVHEKSGITVASYHIEPYAEQVSQNHAKHLFLPAMDIVCPLKSASPLLHVFRLGKAH